MKCPMLFNIYQTTSRTPTYNDMGEVDGETVLFIEKQTFTNCYGPECMAYDKKTKQCKRIKRGKENDY